MKNFHNKPVSIPTAMALNRPFSIHGRNLRSWAVCHTCHVPYSEAHCPHCADPQRSWDPFPVGGQPAHNVQHRPTHSVRAKRSTMLTRVVPLVGLAASLAGALVWFVS